MQQFRCTRRIDKLGRIVLPIEVREKLKLIEGSRLNLILDDNSIVLSKENASKFTDTFFTYCKVLCENLCKQAFILYENKIVVASHKLTDLVNNEIEISTLKKFNNPSNKFVLNNVIVNKKECNELFCFKVLKNGDYFALLCVCGKLTEFEVKMCEFVVALLGDSI